MALLATAFLGQTAWVYLDPSEGQTVDPQATEGIRLWHRHDCQACHQIYGYGGFLGPDLTNAATRYGEDLEPVLDAMLLAGPGGMPAYDLDETEVAALAAWLRHIDGTGVGQARGETLADLPWWEFE